VIAGGGSDRWDEGGRLVDVLLWGFRGFGHPRTPSAAEGSIVVRGFFRPARPRLARRPPGDLLGPGGRSGYGLRLGAGRHGDANGFHPGAVGDVGARLLLLAKTGLNFKIKRFLVGKVVFFGVRWRRAGLRRAGGLWRVKAFDDMPDHAEADPRGLRATGCGEFKMRGGSVGGTNQGGGQRAPGWGRWAIGPTCDAAAGWRVEAEARRRAGRPLPAGANGGAACGWGFVVYAKRAPGPGSWAANGGGCGRSFFLADREATDRRGSGTDLAGTGKTGVIGRRARKLLLPGITGGRR